MSNFVKETIIKTLFLVIAAILTYVMYYMFTESDLGPTEFHIGWYCPRCLHKYHINPSMVHECKYCGYKLYLWDDEIPDSLKQ